MPLRDHYRPPLDDRHSWDDLHGQWPAMIVQQLFPLLPPGYEAAPRVHLSSFFEIDVATFDAQDTEGRDTSSHKNGSSAIAVQAPPKPSLSVETDLPLQDEYEVRVYDARRGRRLVAAIELVSPANNNRPENRNAFVAKCLTLLQQQVSVSIVDLVTVRNFNLYAELLAQIGQEDPSFGSNPPPQDAVTCRTKVTTAENRLEARAFPLTVGQPLPTLPLWLADEMMIALDLEVSYQDTCRVLRIA